ncbi:MAG: RNA pyrophosphohydrolase [Alphaproteobacteria bacterium]|nr:RNA pyrophosphohydrolase [Alphaproteobacteria bacterium]
MQAPTLPYRSCVGIMLINHDGRVFCGERRDTPGAWQMPQGGIQKGEDPSVAVLRELHEEIGVSKAEIIGQTAQTYRYDFPDFLQHRSVYKGKYRGQEQHWFALRFLGSDNDIDLVTHNDEEGPEFIAWKWVGLSEVSRLIVPFKRAVYDNVVAEFKPLIERIKAD